MSYFSSTIGKKQLVGVAGLGLSLFVLTHMAGNLLMFVGPEAYNKYAHALTSNKLIYIIEAGLLGVFLLHLAVALGLVLKNKVAKGSTYAVAPKRSGASFAAKTMQFQGIVIIAFLIWHLITFKYGTYYPAFYDGVEMRDLFKLMVESFGQPLYVAAYFGVLILLGMHLGHGLASSFQTLGFNGEKFDSKIKLIGKIYAALVTVGFLLPPFYIYFVY